MEGPVKHGTRWGYEHHKCRCDDCRAANAERVQRWRDSSPFASEMIEERHSMNRKGNRVRNDPDPLPEGDPRHGTMNGYDYYKCRCDDCKEAIAIDRRVRRGGTAPKNATPKYGTQRSEGKGNPQLIEEFERVFGYYT